MNNTPKLELNIALIPDGPLASKLIAASKFFAKEYPAVVQLNDVNARLAFAPHLTLYQMPIPVSRLDALLSELAAIARTLDAVAAQATTYAYNAGEASMEVQYQTTVQLLQWQEQVIAACNPLRGGILLERDPGGNNPADQLDKTGVLAENIANSGYAEVGDPASGGLFRPHATLNWFDLGTAVDVRNPAAPSINEFNGSYAALGVYLLGPYGTCTQRIAAFPSKLNA